MSRQQVINEITEHLGVLKHVVTTRSKLNLQDINVHSEQLFKRLLNKIYGYELVNINIGKQNAETIDLGDKKNRIAIQVTSNNSKAKITETVNAFQENGLFKDYDTLLVLVIKDKTKRDGTIDKTNFSFDLDRNVLDVNSIATAIIEIDDVEKLNEIQKIISEELVSKYYKSKTSKPNEVKTFLNLITILSDDSNHQTYNNESDPDPEFKIEKRFADYAEYLKNLYSDLLIDYGYALELTETNGDLSTIQIRKIGIYLKDLSNKYLISSSNNPEEALNNLCDFFKQIFVEDNLPFDEMAIKFYLISQLIKCNVFPN